MRVLFVLYFLLLVFSILVFTCMLYQLFSRLKAARVFSKISHHHVISSRLVKQHRNHICWHLLD